MEILILGGILVALMVYASTKIKKSAARAYEREIVEKEDFRIVKPEEFIIPVNENSEFAFESRSKDFGEDAAHNIPQAEVKLKTFRDNDFETVCENAKKSADKILSENRLIDSPEGKAHQIELEKTEGKSDFYIFHKIIENPQSSKIYDLKVSVLKDFRESYEEKINQILNSFAVR